MADLIFCEWLKLKRSKIIVIELLGAMIVPLLLTIQNIRNACSETEPIHDIAWLYEDELMFVMLMFGPLVMTVVTVFLFHREYTEKTLKTLFTVPIGRISFLAAKYILLLFLTMGFLLLSWLYLLAFSILCSLFFEIGQLTVMSAIYFFLKMFKAGALLFAVLTPFGYLTLKSKGMMAPLLALGFVILLNVVMSGAPGGIWDPWLLVYRLATTGRLPGGGPAFAGILLILAVCFLGIGASMVRFYREDLG